MRAILRKLNRDFFDYISRKQFKKAAYVIAEIERNGLFKFDIYYYMGRLEHEKGNYRKGLYYLNKAIHIKPGNCLDYLAKGNIYYDMKRYKDALRSYRKAFAINREDEVVNFNIAMSLWYLERYREAVKFFKRASQFGMKLDVIFVKFYGNSLEAIGQFREAVKLYAKAIRKFPSNATLYELKGDALAMWLDKFSEANRYYTKVEKLKKKSGKKDGNTQPKRRGKRGRLY